MAGDEGRLQAFHAALAQAASPEERIRLRRAIVGEAPGDPRAHCDLARELGRAGDHGQEAIHVYRQALALDPNYAPAHVGLGILYHRRAQPELAEGHYQAALRLNPRLSRAWLNLAALLHERHDWPGARRAYARAAKLRPRDPAARLGLARVCRRGGDLPDAVREYEAALELAPGDPDALRGLARTLGALNDPTATEAYERAVLANPRSASLRTEYAHILLASGRAARAEEVFADAVKANPEAVRLWEQYAQFLREQGRTDDAIGVLRSSLVHTAGEESLRLALIRALCEMERLTDAERELRPLVLGDPRNGHARRLLAAVLACEGRFEEAGSTALAALRVQPAEPSARLLLMPVADRPTHPLTVPLGDDPKVIAAHRSYALAVRGVLQLALGDPTQAGQLLDKAVKAAPEAALPRVGRALAFTATGNLEMAHAELRTAAILQPDNPHVQHLFGESAFHTGHYEEAARAFQATLVDESLDDRLRALTFFCRARAFRKRGLTREALEDYQQAERLDPEYAPSFFGCAVALQESGKPAEALKHYERCVALSPRHGRALFGYAGCLAAVGRAPEAVEAYRSAIAAEPDYAQPRYNLAVLLERAGDPEEVASLLRGYLRREPSGACAEDARRRLHVAELRASGALGAPAPLPEDTADKPFMDSSQEQALFDPGGAPPPIDPRMRV